MRNSLLLAGFFATLVMAPPLLAQETTTFSSVGETQWVPAVARPSRGGKSNKKKVSSPKSKRSSGGGGGKVEVPIDVGFGPWALVPNNPLFADQFVHGAMTLSLTAVIDQEMIRKNAGRIPANYRKQAMKMNEVRIKPLWLGLIPSALVISPAFLNTGIYGVVWHPLGFGLALLSKPVRLSVHADVAFTYLFLHSDTLPSPTHFIRPGLSANATLEIPLSKSVLVSTGWMSDFYVPQPLGQAPWTVLPVEESLWHLGGPFLKLHVRVPYDVNL